MRFKLPDSTPLRKFVIASQQHLALLDLADHDVAVYDPLSADDAPFCMAMNRANCLAYDDSVSPGDNPEALGMPLWVMLDCCLLPTGMFGFEAPRDAIPPEYADLLDPTGALGWIGVSEYVAARALEEASFVGVSLFSLASGCGLGARTKAFGLQAMAARRMTGVTQYDNDALATHLVFGPLEIVTPLVRVHSRPDRSFVYRVELPEPRKMKEIIRGRASEKRLKSQFSVDVRDPAAIRHLATLCQKQRHAIVDVTRDNEGIASVGVRRIDGR